MISTRVTLILHGDVLGDDFLAGNVEHLFHHVDLVADQRDDQVKARLGGHGEFPQPFDRIDIALPHDAHVHHQEGDEHQHRQDQQDSLGPGECSLSRFVQPTLLV